MPDLPGTLQNGDLSALPEWILLPNQLLISMSNLPNGKVGQQAVTSGKKFSLVKDGENQNEPPPTNRTSSCKIDLVYCVHVTLTLLDSQINESLHLDLVTPIMGPPKSPGKRPRPLQRVVIVDESFREKRHKSCDVAPKTPGKF